MGTEFIICGDKKEEARIGCAKDFVSILQIDGFDIKRALTRHQVCGHFSPWLEHLGEMELSRMLKPFEKKEIECYAMAAEVFYTDLKFEKPDFFEVMGYEGAKEALRELAVYPAKMSEVSKRYGRGECGGVLLYGPPGTGKTYLANALAGETSKLFVKWSPSESFRDNYALKRTFDLIKTAGGGVLSLDDMEIIASVRDKPGHDRALTNALLSELDQAVDVPLVVVGSTNFPWNMDQSIIRSGRLGSLIYVGVPDKETRVELFGFYSRGLPVGSVDFEQLAEKTEFYSCSDIKALCSEAASIPWKEAIRGKESREIGQEDFEKAIEKMPSTSLAWFEEALDIACAESVKKRFAPMFEEIEKYREVKNRGNRAVCYG